MHKPQIDVAGLVVLFLDVTFQKRQKVEVAAFVRLAGNVLRFDNHQHAVVLVKHRNVVHGEISTHFPLLLR